MVNVITENSKRPRGRPKGHTERGLEARSKLYETAIRLFSERGYEETTLRDIAAEAGVSPALLYKYFPGKSAVVLELYDALSRELEIRARDLRPVPWRERALEALEASLSVLSPHRATLAALVPVLIGDPEQGVFSERTAFSRLRVARGLRRGRDGCAGAPPEAGRGSSRSASLCDPPRRGPVVASRQKPRGKPRRGA